jgi:hypothetical protein
VGECAKHAKSLKMKTTSNATLRMYLSSPCEIMRVRIERRRVAMSAYKMQG